MLDCWKTCQELFVHSRCNNFRSYVVPENICIFGRELCRGRKQTVPHLKLNKVNFSEGSVILLPLRSISKNPNNSRHASRRMQRLINRSEHVHLQKSPVPYNFCGSCYGCCLTMHISFSLCCALKQKDYILISVYSNTECWSLSSDKLSGYVKAQAFSISD